MKLALALTVFASTSFAATGRVQQIEVRPGGIIVTIENQRAPLCPTLPDSFKNAIVNIAVTAKTQNKPVAYVIKKASFGPSTTCLDSIAL